MENNKTIKKEELCVTAFSQNIKRMHVPRAIIVVLTFIIFAACGKTEKKVSYYENGSKKETIGTHPRPAPFSGEYDDIEPSVSPDGKRLFFGSNRPLTGKGETKDTDI